MYLDEVEKIGSVLLRRIEYEKANVPISVDEAVENELLKRFKNHANGMKEKREKKTKDYSLEYYLSPIRENLLKWFPFDKDSKLLEIGSECGALTGLFCSKLAKVTTLDNVYHRAKITALRHAECQNLEVVIGDLNKFEAKEEFEYVTVIGTLESAHSIFGGHDALKLFLSNVHTILKPKGILLLATDNKIGFEDMFCNNKGYNSNIFETLYNYPHPNKTKIFNMKELSELLHSVGFSYLDWYYPFPDYRFPQKVFYDNHIHRNIENAFLHYHAETHSKYSSKKLLEKQISRMLIQAGLFREFANSFLVVAKKSNFMMNFRCLGFTGTNTRRKREYRTNTIILEENNKKAFLKKADSEDSIVFIKRIAQRDKLASIFFNGYAEVIMGNLKKDSIYYPYLTSPTLEGLIECAIKDKDVDFGAAFVKGYVDFIDGLPSKESYPLEFMKEFGIVNKEKIGSLRCLLCAPIDCIPGNIIVDGQFWKIVDNEWTYDFPLPIDFLIYRGIYSLVINLQEEIQSNISKECPVVLLCGYGKNRTYIPKSWLDLIRTKQIPFKQLTVWEWSFKRKVFIEAGLGRLRLKRNPRLVRNIMPLSSIIISSIIRKINRLKHEYIRYTGAMRNKIKRIYTRLHS